MTGWIDRAMAALGLGGRKPEADVSYDPAQVDRSSGRAPKAARADEGTASSGIAEPQFDGLPESDPAGRDDAPGPAREPGGP
jgi:hypothetical protein